VISRTSFTSIKISWETIEELVQKINLLKARKIISISFCAGEWTDTNQWSKVFYEYDV